MNENDDDIVHPINLKLRANQLKIDDILPPFNLIKQTCETSLK